MYEFDSYLNGHKRHAEQTQTDRTSSDGVISAFDPVTQTAKVMLQPDNIETGWIQVKTPWTGNGWGMFCPPTIKQAVTVHFTNGDLDDPWIGLHAHNDVDKPLPVPSGEFWLVHNSGQCLKFTNNGSITLGGATGGAIGSIMLGDPAALHQMMTDVAMAVYNNHTHKVTAVGADTAVPTQQMTAQSDLTQQTKAS